MLREPLIHPPARRRVHPQPAGNCGLCGGLGFRDVLVDYKPNPRNPDRQEPVYEQRDCEECGGTGSERRAEL